MSAAFCTFDPSDVRFATYKLRAASTKDTISGTVSLFPVFPDEGEVEVVELEEPGVQLNISNRRGRK